jgi:hypothetical protein
MAEKKSAMAPQRSKPSINFVGKLFFGMIIENPLQTPAI